jgi:4,5-dihydroxyphthalate decarboxylase
MTTATALRLRTVFNGNNPSLQPLRDGRVKIRGVDMDQVAVPNIIVPFRRMGRYVEFDISELAVVTYYVARRYNLPMTALPVFPSSWVEQGQGIVINKKFAQTAKDLEGKAVGMRAYTVTPSAWQRDYLKRQGCDISKVTWISNDEEHIAQFHPDAPKNLHYWKGANLAQMLSEGEIAALFSAPAGDDPNVVPLNASFKEDGIGQFKQDHVYHPIHLMLVKNSVLEANPWVLRATYDAFKEAKEIWLAEHGPVEPWEDPLPMGMTETRKSLEVLMDLAVEHGLLEKPLDLDEIFPGNFD